MRISWDKLFSKQVSDSDPDDHLKQVGHTVKGKSIPSQQFEALTSQIVDIMQLSANDSVMDLCCGNGLFTKKVAKHVKTVIGIDFCEPLIDIASTRFLDPNIRYYQGDVRYLEKMNANIIPHEVNKVIWYAALQHFRPTELKSILSQILRICAEPLIFIGFVPDNDLKYLFYNTARRKIAHLWRLVSMNDNFGFWWNRSKIEAICSELDMTCTFSNIPSGMHASKYRFNVLIEKRPVGD